MCSDSLSPLRLIKNYLWTLSTTRDSVRHQRNRTLPYPSTVLRHTYPLGMDASPLINLQHEHTRLHVMRHNATLYYLKRVGGAWSPRSACIFIFSPLLPVHFFSVHTLSFRCLSLRGWSITTGVGFKHTKTAWCMLLPIHHAKTIFRPCLPALLSIHYNGQSTWVPPSYGSDHPTQRLRRNPFFSHFLALTRRAYIHANNLHVRP